MAQNPVAIITSVEDVVVLPDDGQIVITLDIGGPKVDLALEPDLALRLVDACAKGYADSRRYQEAAQGIADTSFRRLRSKLARMTSRASWA